MKSEVVSLMRTFGFDMRRRLKVLICSGSFKDVFSPFEACEMLRQAVGMIADEYDASISVLPLADGGEHSLEVLQNLLSCHQIDVDNVVDPCGVAKTVSYLQIEENTAYISSSECLRLLPEQDSVRNPLIMTSYGLGQLIDHAIGKGFKSIYLGLGGTSTVDGGIGMAQALGALFQADNERMLSNDGHYLTGCDMCSLRSIVCNTLPSIYDNINVQVVLDGCITLDEMRIPTLMKIGECVSRSRLEIAEKLEMGITNYCNVVSTCLRHRRQRDLLDGEALASLKGVGAAGGILLSLLLLFRPRIITGSDYFLAQAGFERIIKDFDVVITGEGRFDNSFAGKTGVGVCRHAKKWNKPVIYVCGTVEESMKKHFNAFVASALPMEYKTQGISMMISFHEFFDRIKLPENYGERCLFYKRNMPRLVADGLRQCLRKIKE